MVVTQRIPSRGHTSLEHLLPIPFLSSIWLSHSSESSLCSRPYCLLCLTQGSHHKGRLSGHAFVFSLLQELSLHLLTTYSDLMMIPKLLCQYSLWLETLGFFLNTPSLSPSSLNFYWIGQKWPLFSSLVFLNWEWLWPPGASWQCVETFLVATTWRGAWRWGEPVVLLEPGLERPGMPLSFLLGAGQRMIWPHMSVGPT